MAVGGVGVEGDGLYTIDRDPLDNDQPFEEIIAVAASRGFESPPPIRADNILVEGIRLPFANVSNPPVRDADPVRQPARYGPGSDRRAGERFRSRGT